MSTRPASKAVEVNGVRLHYLEWGKPGAPDLLLVHGWTGLAMGWATVAEALEDRYHIVAPDLRGHGKSDKPTTGYRLRDFTEDVRGLIQALGLRRPAYAGGSWGGAIGVRLAADHPDLISSAVLADPVAWRILSAFVQDLPPALARKARPEAEIRAEAAQRGLTGEAADFEVYRHHHFLPEAVTRLLTDNRDWALMFEEYLQRVAVPTLLLVADPAAGGFILREEMAYYQQVASPKVQFRFWEGVGHGMFQAQPKRFIQEFVEFNRR